MTAGYALTTQVERLDQKLAALRLQKQRILTNGAKWESETDEAMTDRLQRNRTRTGKREARYRMTGTRQKPSKLLTQSLLYRTFEYLYERCRGSGFHGVELRLDDMAKALGCSKRHLIRVISDLDKKYRLVVRLRGKPNRYAGSLPESEVYRDILSDTFGLRTNGLRQAAKVEAREPDLEPATTIGLKRFQDEGYRLPDECLRRLRASYHVNCGLEEPQEW